MSVSKAKVLMNLEEVTRVYTMGSEKVYALNGVSMDLLEGEFITIVGSSGSGKSTLLHILGLLDSPSSGTMSLREQRLDGIHDDELSRTRNASVGMVFQQFNLLADLTVCENIALPLAYAGVPRHERLERASVIAGKVGLGERLDHKPKELSGGQAQRVAIARALVSDPDVIMADEPTGALDSKTGVEIMALFHQLHAEGKTIIMVTHDDHLADQGSRKITIGDGKILKDERKAEPHVKIEKQAAPSLKTPGSRNGGLAFADMLRIGIHEGLLAHMMRTALTMLGVIIGVASVVAMSSFSEGSKQKQADQIKALGVNLIKIMDKRLEGELLNDARKRGSYGLSYEDLRVLKENISGLASVSWSRDIKLNVLNDLASIPQQIIVKGIGGDFGTVNNLSLQSGRFVNSDDAMLASRVAVIGDGLRQRLKLSAEDCLGETLTMGGQIYEIVGVLANKRIDTEDLEIKQVGDTNDAILIPIEAIAERMKYHDLRSSLDEIQLQMVNEDELFRAGLSIRRILKARHAGVDDVDLFIPLDMLKAKQQSQKLLDVLSLSICGISLLVGGIGIMNIMLASVSERMKEIGIRRAIGALKKDIQMQFLCESVLISFVGSLIGLGCAILSVFILCSFLDLPVVFSGGLMMLSIVLAMLTGVVFGFFPAKRASENNVIEVLRNE